MSNPFPPFQAHSETSLQAAAAAYESADTLRAKVWRFVHAAGEHGATDTEIQAHLKLDPSTERPRRVELCREGLLRDSGRKRLTLSRRKAVVWISTLRPEGGS